MNNWIVQAIVIAITASTVLNSALFIPYLRTRKIKRIDARLVGFGGTTAAFLLWCALNPQRPAWPDAFGVLAAIVALTLGPNWLVHKCRGDSDGDGGMKTIQIKMTEKGALLLEKYLEGQAPDDPELSGLFMVEQRGESPQERWEDAMIPISLLGLLDESVAFIVQAWRKQPEPCLLTAAAEAVEARQGICTARNKVQLWYRLFWPQNAR